MVIRRRIGAAAWLKRFCIRTKADAEIYLMGIYLRGLRGEVEDSAEISRLKALGWHLVIYNAEDALKTSQHEDYFASWNWPFGELEYK